MPSWIEIIPAGGAIKGRDGRQYNNSDPEKIVNAFNSIGQPLIVDFEHASEILAPKGFEAPAAAWVEKMAAKPDGSVWGEVNWTPKGEKSVSSREYRFTSPAYKLSTDSSIIGISSIGLVGKPNLDLSALNNHQPETKKEKSIMDLTAITSALDLNEGASVGQIASAINSLKEEKSIALNSVATPDLKKFVPRADFDALKETSEKTLVELNSAHETSMNIAINSVIDQALVDGKITPATKEYHVKQCKQPGGLDNFSDFIKSAPSIGDETSLNSKQPDDKSEITLEDRWVAKQLGHDLDEKDKK